MGKPCPFGLVCNHMIVKTDIESKRSAELLTKVEKLQHQGLLLQKEGELDLAVSVYERVLELGGDSAQTRFNLGAARLKQIRPNEAIEQFKAGVRIKPDEEGLHLGIANAYKLMGNMDAAETHLEKELEVCPESIYAAVNLGWMLEEQNRVPEALVQYRKAMYYNVNDPVLRWNHGLACLRLGDYSRGWRDYEYRWDALKKQKPPSYGTPKWHGEPLTGRRLLLHSEQAFGDSIMFTRFALRLASINESVYLQCQPQLKRLFAAQNELHAVLGMNEHAPEHDVHASLMSLPHLMHLTRETDMSSQPYLKLDEQSFEPLPAVSNSESKLVAVTWASAPNSEITEKKSIPYGEFQQLFKVPGCHFYSVQVNADDATIANLKRQPNVSDLSRSIIDFKDTADYLRQMDLVISVDTATAHLAGAMGIPTWVLLPYAADWRWRMHRNDSPWYPTMRLFRQQHAGDWEQVLEEVGHCLFNYGAQISSSRLNSAEAGSISPHKLPIVTA